MKFISLELDTLDFVEDVVHDVHLAGADGDVVCALIERLQRHKKYGECDSGVKATALRDAGDVCVAKDTMQPPYQGLKYRVTGDYDTPEVCADDDDDDESAHSVLSTEDTHESISLCAENLTLPNHIVERDAQRANSLGSAALAFADAGGARFDRGDDDNFMLDDDECDSARRISSVTPFIRKSFAQTNKRSVLKLEKVRIKGAVGGAFGAHKYPSLRDIPRTIFECTQMHWKHFKLDRARARIAQRSHGRYVLSEKTVFSTTHEGEFANPLLVRHVAHTHAARIASTQHLRGNGFAEHDEHVPLGEVHGRWHNHMCGVRGCPRMGGGKLIRGLCEAHYKQNQRRTQGAKRRAADARDEEEYVRGKRLKIARSATGGDNAMVEYIESLLSP